MGIIDELISGGGAELVSTLTEQAGFSPEQAQEFLPAATGQVVEQVQSGGLDLGALLGGDGIRSLISNLDVESLASQTGIDVSQASSGLESLVPALLSSLQSKAGGAEGILSLLDGGEEAGEGGGVLGTVGRLAGRLLGR